MVIHYDTLNNAMQGTLKVFCINSSGKILRTFSESNILTFAICDVYTKAISGNPEYRITHIFAEHAAHPASGYVEGSLNGLVAAKSNTYETQNTAPRTTSGAEMPILQITFDRTTEHPPGTPIAHYSHNILTTSAVMSNSALVNRIFVAAGLATQIGANKILIARAIHPGIILTTAFNIVYFWTIRLLNE